MTAKKNEIYVTQPSLPPLGKFIPYLKEIWENKWLTNNGIFHVKFEKELADFLGVPFVSLINNGTSALSVALEALNIDGEVITTPYSFIATSHVIKWHKLNPVFVDIEADSCNIDPNKIESAITPNTSAIMPVHVYGTPCDVARIDRIAKKYNLKVIYDAAHAFGVEKDNSSILLHGDLSILSFHATKVFNTFEGGAIICKSKELKERIDLLKNFGIQDEENITSVGINAKMNEFQSALGLVQLQHFNEIIASRKKVFQKYQELLGGLKGIKLLTENINYNLNYSYFPIFIDEKKYGYNRNQVHQKLLDEGIHTRKYFYPLISNTKPYQNIPSSNATNLPNANNRSEEVLCLPIYPELNADIIHDICSKLIEYSEQL